MGLQQREIDGVAAAPPLQHVGSPRAQESNANGESLRVTPEEVALAAAAWEAKRDAEHTWRETTLPLDEAVNHIGLNAPAHELASEILSLRAERAEKIRTEQIKQRTRGIAGIAAVVGLISLLAVVGVLWSSLAQSRRALHNVLHPMTSLPIQKLDSIPDNTPVHIDSNTLAKLATGEAGADTVSVDTRAENSEGLHSGTMFNNEWTLVKSGDVLLVRGWATAEFALNISNDTTGGMFSSRPGWLPVNNLVPIQVPVYRLEGQQFVRYLPDGKGADSAANSVLMSATVIDGSGAAADLVRRFILGSDLDFTNYDYPSFNYVQTSVTNNILHLTGHAHTARLKRLAVELAVSTVQRPHLPCTVSDEMKIVENSQ